MKGDPGKYRNLKAYREGWGRIWGEKGRVELSDKAKAERRPLPPGMLAGALHDAIPIKTGKARPARAARLKGKEQADHIADANEMDEPENDGGE